MATLTFILFIFLLSMLILDIFPKNTGFIPLLFRSIRSPIIFFGCCYPFYATASLIKSFYPETLTSEQFQVIIYCSNIVIVATAIWLVFNILGVMKSYLLQLALSTNHTTIAAILPSISNSMYAILLLIAANLFIPELGLTTIPNILLVKTSKVLFIGTLGWIFIQIINALEKYILNQYFIEESVNFITSRKLKTQVLILKRVIISIGLIIIIATILMVFDSVKNLGTGILTTAGILSAMGAFASQQSLSRLFSGLQLAFTQPIRIGDTIIIDNEFGQVEEINLSYVVIKLWDLRRLIKPTDYFTTQGLQNLTRDSTQLLGTIFLYTDYTLPVQEVRVKFFDLLAKSTLWDGKVKSLDVTDVTEKAMELRGLMSAENSSDLWKLRCEIRESLMTFLVTTYPHCLAKSRNTTVVHDVISQNSTASQHKIY